MLQLLQPVDHFYEEINFLRACAVFLNAVWILLFVNFRCICLFKNTLTVKLIFILFEAQLKRIIISLVHFSIFIRVLSCNVFMTFVRISNRYNIFACVKGD